MKLTEIGAYGMPKLRILSLGLEPILHKWKSNKDVIIERLQDEKQDIDKEFQLTVSDYEYKIEKLQKLIHQKNDVINALLDSRIAVKITELNNTIKQKDAKINMLLESIKEKDFLIATGNSPLGIQLYSQIIDLVFNKKIIAKVDKGTLGDNSASWISIKRDGYHIEFVFDAEMNSLKHISLSQDIVEVTNLKTLTTI